MKRIICSVLAIVMAFSLLPPLSFAESFEGYTAIKTKSDLQNIKNDLSGNYYLANDIVFSDSDFIEGGEFYNDGAGFLTIGSF